MTKSDLVLQPKVANAKDEEKDQVEIIVEMDPEDPVFQSNRNLNLSLNNPQVPRVIRLLVA